MIIVYPYDGYRVEALSRPFCPRLAAPIAKADSTPTLPEAIIAALYLALSEYTSNTSQYKDTPS
jgi:hypothetical protein